MIHLHILVADADTQARRGIEAALRRDPFFTVRACGCGAQALKAAVAWRPDLILLALAMPDMDGPAVLRRLRADKRTAPIPTVFVAGRGEAGVAARADALGAAGVIAKPFDPLGLAADVRRFVPAEGVLAPAREGFVQRLRADAMTLSAWGQRLAQKPSDTAVIRINEIAHSLAGAGGIFGFAGITCASAALAAAAENTLAGRAGPVAVERALNRLLARIAP